MFCKIFTRSVVFVAILCCHLQLHAQSSNSLVNTGTWKLQQYAGNVFKISFTPKGYTTNEQISNAVPGRPMASSKIPVVFTDSTCTIAGKEIRIFQQDQWRGFRFDLQDDEQIFGGGERALPLNRRGYRFDLYNNPWYGYSNGADNLNFSVPFFTSSKGYGLFFDNVSKGYADIAKTDAQTFEAGFSSGELNCFLIIGADYKTILTSYYNLTGKQPLPPKWAMGNFMSRFGYTSEAQTKSIAAQMKQEHIPFDAIIFDLFWFGDSIKGTLGNLDWVNTTKWPAPKKMIGDFKKDNINSILIAEPFMLEGTRNYVSSKPYLAVDSSNRPFRLTDFYFGFGGLLDIFRPEAGDWIWKQHYKKQIANGVHAWWTDLGEPEKHPAEIRHNLKSLGIKRLMGANEVHNAYGHYWNKMLSEHYAKEYPNQRLFHLNRSGFSGSQRFSIFPWSGDISRSWSGLQAQLPLMLGMSMSGIPYIHADAGGFAGGEGDRELYVRWLQFAAFTPIFRPHGTALFEVDPNAYSFPSEPALIDTPWRNYARNAVNTRYALLPYNYTLAYQQAAHGAPLVAPLCYHFPEDSIAATVQDEFMWGENILVAPVTEKALKSRSVYLPKGNWYRLGENSIVSGSFDEPLSMFNIPVFVKAGSFISTVATEGINNTRDISKDELTVTYYADTKSSSGVLYNDDGESRQALVNRQFELIHFNAVYLKTGLRIAINSNKGVYSGKPAVRNIRLLINGLDCEGKKLTINGAPVELKKVSPRLQYSCNISFTGKPVMVAIQ